MDTLLFSPTTRRRAKKMVSACADIARIYISNLFCERSSAMRNNGSDASVNCEEWNAETELINPFNSTATNYSQREKSVIFRFALFFPSPAFTCSHNRLMFCGSLFIKLPRIVYRAKRCVRFSHNCIAKYSSSTSLSDWLTESTV